MINIVPFRAISFVILLLLGRGVNAQKQPETAWAIKFSPLSLIDPAQSAIQLGAEVALMHSLSIQGELGYLTNTAYSTNNIFPGRKGFKTRAELRFYDRKETAKLTGRYLAVELFLTQNTYNREDLFEERDTIAGCKEIYRLHKMLAGFNLKAGYLKIYKSGFLLDFYYGAGMKYRNVRHSDKDCESSNFGYDQCFSCAAHRQGKFFIPNITLGLKVGYVFRRH